MTTGLDFILFKMAGEALQAGVAWNAPFVMSNWISGILLSTLVLWSVNLAMQLYNNIEV